MIPDRPGPPLAPRRPHEHVVHGDRRRDDYHWLRERFDPEVIAYLEAENRYTEEVMAPLGGLRDDLYREMVARIRETDSTVPVEVDDRFYYTRTEAGKQYGIFCRRTGSPDAPEEVILDENELSAGQSFFHLGALRVSPDHRLLAYIVDLDGSEEHVLHVKDLETGRLLPDRIAGLSRGLEWSRDSRSLYYALLDASKRPYRVLRHRLGEDSANDVFLHEEIDEAYFASLSRSRSRRFLFLTLKSKVSSEVHALDLADPAAELRVIEPRRRGIEYYVEHREETFYILTNDGARSFRVMEAPVASPGRESWTELVPESRDATIQRIDAFIGHLVLHERRDGLKGIRILDIEGGRTHQVAFPEPVYTLGDEPNPGYKGRLLRFNYSSFVVPSTVYDYDMETRELRLLKRHDVVGDHDPARYISERIHATAPDGTRVPISLVYPVGASKDERSALWLHGYGAYGISSDPSFRAERLSLLERGVIIAIAHVRGGSELGRAWYEGGKLLHKKNTFTDFIAAADHLVGNGYTSRDRLAISGGSAGGLLIGASLNLRPDLCRVAVADVPFVDVLNTMLDPSLPLTITEYDEWGDPRDPACYEYIRSYAPYENVLPGEYPDLVVTAGLNDPRVGYWEPAKWVAKLRALERGPKLLLLKTNMDAGHRGPSGRYAFLEEVAFRYAFVLERLGVAPSPAPASSPRAR